MDEFEFQLQQEEVERQQKEAVSASKAPTESNEASAEPTSSNNESAGTTSYSTTYTDPNDGTVYEWDFDRKAWFPKIDEDFIASYQASYGEHKLNLTQPSLAPADALNQLSAKETGEKGVSKVSKEQLRELQKERKKEKRRLEAERQKTTTWFEIDDSKNTNVYVSGLPSDITDEEFEKLMSKCGVIARELNMKKAKLKLYRDDEGNVKGDGRCCYIKRESVDLALSILDGSQVGQNRIKVEVAHFEQKGQFDPSKRKKLTAKMKKRLKEQQEKLFGWMPERLKGERPRSDSTVVIKNLFTLEELNDNPVRLFDLQEELKRECQKYGTVKKLMICDNNAEGVAMVTFAEAEEADDCVTMLNYRVWSSGRQLKASSWDGKTRYKVAEKKDDQEKRIDEWARFLDEPAPATSAETQDERQENVKETSPKLAKTETEAIDELEDNKSSE